MTVLCDSPFGFEDGQIVGYRASAGRLEVDFEFWNQQRHTLVFNGIIGVYDAGAVGVTVGSAAEVKSSVLIALLARRHFAKLPDSIDWKHYCFFDLDDCAMFDIVAQSCNCVSIPQAPVR